MAAINTGIPLSGSDSTPININTLASPGVLIHTADTDDHYLNIWACNIDTNLVTLTVLKGSTGLYYIDSVVRVPPRSPKIPIEPGVLLTNSYEYRIYADVSNAIKISGFVLKRAGE